MFYQVLSFDYKNCEQSIREKLAFNLDDVQKDFLKKIIEFKYIDEIYILSTCNRVEIVTSNRDTFATMHIILGFLSKKSNIDFYELENMAQIYNNEEAIYHIFSVVSSLSSLVLGESQITGQVKQAFKFAVENKFSSKKLNIVISQSVKCAAEVRKATNISKNPLSIATIAIFQAQKILLNLKDVKSIVIGAGAMSKIVIKNLVRLKAKVLVLCRNREKISTLFGKLDKNIIYDEISNLDKYIDEYPLLFSATSSDDYIIDSSLIKKIEKNRLWFDLAVPRDIENIFMDNLTIFYIDDLRKIAEDNQSLKKEQLKQAKDIVLNYQKIFYKNLKRLSIEPVMKEIRIKVNNAIEEELKRCIKKNFIPIEYEANINKMAQQMFNKFLHNPSHNMRNYFKNSDLNNFNMDIKKIFDIE